MIHAREQIPWKDMGEIIESMEKTSFCALGQSIAVPYYSYLSNVLKKCILRNHE
jgi:NADH:ubiquinone oxidoreductase subunit F (NADH-binding)